MPIPGQWGFTQNESRAKFEEYGNINSFWFDHLFFSTVTTDYRYFTDFYASHIGNNDQYYRLQLGETGKQYLTLQWDQLPHLYSTTAQSVFGGSSTFLTAPPAGATAGFGGACPSAGTTTFLAAQACAAAIQANVHTINLGIQRDKGTVTYRSTPDDKSEFKVEYSHERRWGNIETGVSSGQALNGTVGPSGTAFAVPMPIADTTHDARATYQYTGTSPWGMRFTANAQYGVSIYRDDFPSFLVQNPFYGSTQTANATPGYLNQPSLWPSNNGAISHRHGRRRPAGEEPLHGHGLVHHDAAERCVHPAESECECLQRRCDNSAISGNDGGSELELSAGSLDGKVDTLLINNVLTTQLSPDLKNKLTYRFYDYDNRTAPFLLLNHIINDTITCSTASGGGAVAGACPHVSQFSSQTKQNAGDELTWRPTRWLTTGIGYGWEHIDYTLSNATSTNENTGKVFADARPTDWLTVRSSYVYGVRTNQNYDYLNNVYTTITAQPPACNTATMAGCLNIGGIEQNPLERIFTLADRVRQKGNFYVDFDVAPGITITPTVGFKLDRYNDPPIPLQFTVGNPVVSTIGFKKDNDINLGVDSTIQLTSSAKLITSYMYEAIDRDYLWASGNTGPTGASPLANFVNVASKDFVHTVAVKLALDLKPRVLDLVLGYTFQRALETGAGVSCAPGSTAATCTSAGNLVLENNLPNVTNTYQLFDAVLKYKFDQDQVKAWGWTGQGYVKLRYAYEMNRVTNWQSDVMMPFMFAVAPSGTGGGNKVWLAGDNPNYNAQLIMATLGLTW